MKKNSLDIYWENKLDFKYEEEILRYKMLCNDKISKKLVKKYNRNLLGGLYRENPVKSRNYEAVKSSKKWENVGNSYIIPIFERQIQVILFFLFQF